MKTLIIKYDMILGAEHVKMLSEAVAQGIRNGYLVLGPEFTYEVVEFDSLVVEKPELFYKKDKWRKIRRTYKRTPDEIKQMFGVNQSTDQKEECEEK